MVEALLHFVVPFASSEPSASTGVTITNDRYPHVKGDSDPLISEPPKTFPVMVHFTRQGSP
jgi:hypothetical protein